MEDVLKILEENFPDIDFAAENALIDDGILTSLDIVMLVGELSNAFDVEISVDDLLPENFNSATAIAALIQRLQSE